MKEWDNFKKELTWENTKVIICALVPLGFGGWVYVQWINLLTPIINHYNSTVVNIATPEQTVILLCMMCGLVFPIWPCFMWPSQAGLWVGKNTRLFKDNKTRYVVLDEVHYYIRDMPEDQREQMKQILSSYKTKYQLRQESKASQSWLRRNFS